MYKLQDDSYNFFIYPISLGDANTSYYLLLYEDHNNFETLVNIVKYNNNFNMWQCVFCEILPFTRVRFYNRKWDLTDNMVLVLYSAGVGSGGFVSYDVIGEEDEKIVKYVYEDYIFKGSIFFEDEKLIRGTGNQFRVWKKIDDKFVLDPYNVPVYPGAVEIRYSIPNENTVEIDQTNFTVPVGTIVQFIREDFNDVKERILITNCNSCLKHLKYLAFKSTCKTTITATIIPDGYNWDGAVDVIITVK